MHGNLASLDMSFNTRLTAAGVSQLLRCLPALLQCTFRGCTSMGNFPVAIAEQGSYVTSVDFSECSLDVDVRGSAGKRTLTTLIRNVNRSHSL